MESVRPAILWTLGRVAARVPVYGPLNVVVPGEIASDWTVRFLELAPDDPHTVWTLMQMTRRTDDRYRDIPDKLRERVIGWLHTRGAGKHLITLVHSGGQLDVEEQTRAFGEALPKGLRIM
jgi:DNA-K related protein